ncbi:DUF6338 family protein [Streptomyces griseorubiginosus]|uniref:DUF6338 family protein n=1 Tax=Streptomyces griseorubiginosus TaxID=67304 RepID=UPI0036ED8670
MPVTLIGLLIFIVLLSPGMAYTWAKERSLPYVKMSPFRETATVAFASAASVTASLIIFSVIHALMPSWTPDIGALIRRPGGYFRDHYTFIVWWVAGILFGAIALALTFGRFNILRIAANRAVFWSAPNPEKSKTEWEAAFTRKPGCVVAISLLLDDGWVISGDLASRSASTTEETQDRELTLDGPIFFQAPGSTEQEACEFHSVVISARRIIAIAVTYVEP